MGKIGIIHTAWLVVVFSWACCAHAGEPLDRLTALIQSGDYDGAWALAEELEPAHAGAPAFDLLYGLAAYHTDRHDLAVFAFERLAWQYPNDPRIRLALASARLATGEDHRTRQHLEAVLAKDTLPSDMRPRVRHYQEAVAQRGAGSSGNSGYVSGLVGYDSNINNATAAKELSFPGSFVTIPLPDEARQQASGFTELDAGGRLERLVNRQRGWFAQGRYRNRSNFSSGEFDQDIIEVSAGPSLRHGSSRFRLPLQVQTVLLDGTRFRNTVSVAGEWVRSLGREQAVLVLVQAAQARYPDDSLRDSHTVTGGGHWMVRQAGGARVYGITLAASSESTRRDEGDHLGRDLGVLRISGRWRVSPDHLASLALTGLYVRHHADHPLFQDRRWNTNVRLTVDWQWAVTAKWHIEAEVNHVDNASPIDFYEYAQSQVKVGVVYAFQ
ncbi:MAG: hypothetical protein WED00_05435 [Aquisalimonadaceae bacterium]